MSCMREKRNVYRIFMDKLEERKAIGRPRCTYTWERIAQIDLEEIGWGTVV